MSGVNKQKDNLQILCEDQINKEMAAGFLQGLQYNSAFNAVPVEVHQKLAGGWCKAVQLLKDEWFAKLKNHQSWFLMVLIDFDGNENRIHEIKETIPPELIDRVFIIGCYHEPEKLKGQAQSVIKSRDTKTKHSNENVGRELFRHCKGVDGDNLWDSEELRHNAKEIKRLKEKTDYFINWV